MTDTTKQRPVFRNIHVSDIVKYRLPPAGIVSILHRISGAAMFLLMPFAIWLFDSSVTSEISYERFANAFVAGIGFVPAVIVKLVVWALIGAYLVHFIAGLRHLWMDMTHSVSKEQGHSSAVATLAITLVLWLPIGAKLFGLY
jgi:succinate dehydrogenase / fumarate reductase, cytochrome b subunit